MHCKPLVGLNADYRAAGMNAPAYAYLASGYYDCILRAGGIPVIVPPMDNEDNFQSILDALQGFVIVGGQDLDPRRDGFMLHPCVRVLDARREKFDRLLMRLIAERRMPVLRHRRRHATAQRLAGRQPVPAHSGGPAPGAAAQGPAGPRPPPRPGSGARLAHGAGLRRRRNPRQQHAPHGRGRSGAGLRASPPAARTAWSKRSKARSTDWFAFGTQFHPEATSASALDLRIFEEFIDGARRATHVLRMAA